MPPSQHCRADKVSERKHPGPEREFDHLYSVNCQLVGLSRKVLLQSVSEYLIFDGSARKQGH
jgi:hypothetical protein